MNNSIYNGLSNEEKVTEINKVTGDEYTNCNGKYEKSFLEQFGSFGISLYKGEDDLNNWSKLTLNNSQSSGVKPTPCN